MPRDDRVLNAEYEITVDKGVKLNNSSVDETVLNSPYTLSFTVRFQIMWTYPLKTNSVFCIDNQQNYLSQDTDLYFLAINWAALSQAREETVLQAYNAEQLILIRIRQRNSSVGDNFLASLLPQASSGQALK